MKETLAEYQSTPPTLKEGENTLLQVDTAGNLKSTLSVALDDVNDSITSYPKCLYSNRTASALIKTGEGQIYGIVINSHTSGTLKLWDNTAASGSVICETITFAVGERFIPLLGATFATGLYATIGGTANITILYR